MKTPHEILDNIQDAAHQVHLGMEHGVNRTLMRQHAAIEARLAQQQKDLQRLRSEVAVLRKQRASGGGFPWGLLLLAGAGYVLYRNNPQVREQVQGLLRRVNPGVEGNVTRAGDAVKEGVSNLARGESPAAAFQTAGGELRRGGEKVVSDVKANLEEGRQDR
ncbi:hypothetical protein [Deinococcus sp. YIM 77859]|uniref:hypothetical protein n=1 Tax=Deinococcus sp. YIM 77859 TaxID=1540221 RepID=UPI000AAA63A7|nr:hypothetical protein [Deinococcus sp. YIM 77859]